MNLRQEIDYRLRNHPYKVPVFTSVHCIPERINQYDPSLFVVYNSRDEVFEIHDIDLEGDTRTSTLPFKELDARTVHYVWENDIRVHGTEIFKRIERSEKRAEEDQKRQYKNWVEDVAKETQSMFAKDAWT